MKCLIKRIYHPYDVWEEVRWNMWGKVESQHKDKYFKQAVIFTGNAEEYGKYMIRVVKEWKYSCEHNLTDLNQNRRAWIGHAACALALGCPEDITRKAWGILSEKQQFDANAVADIAIQMWEKQHLGDLCQK